MNRERYEAVTGFFYENDKARYALQFTYHFLPLLLFVAYPALLIYTLIQYGFDEVCWCRSLRWRSSPLYGV